MLYHALGIEKGAIKGDGVAHHIAKALLVAIEQGKNDLLKFLVECCCILGPLVVCDQATISGPNGPASDPLDPPPSHQPSSTLNEGTPLSAAFMPLVPEASSGGCGVLSQTSTPAVSKAPRLMS